MIKIINKQELNLIRGTIRMKLANLEYASREVRKDVFAIKDLRSGDINKVKDACDRLNSEYNCRITPFALPSDKIRYVEEESIGVLNNLDKLKDATKLIISSISYFGIKRVTYLFPTMFTDINNSSLAYQYMIITGIKYNGEHGKTDVNFTTSWEYQLHKYEQDMAKLINEDYSIDFDKATEFMNIFALYLKCYADNLSKQNTGKLPGECLDNALNFMSFYVQYSKEFLRERKEHLVAQEWAQNSLQFRSDKDTEVSSNEDTKQEKSEILDPRQLLLKEIVLEDLFELYNRAKKSGSIRTIRTLRDIDASLDLLLELGLDGNQELISECASSLSSLEDALEPKIVYYKSSNNGEVYPLILDGITTIKHDDYESIGTTLEDLALGNISGGREIKGDFLLPLYVSKAGSSRIFYTVVDDSTVMVINCVNKTTSDNEIKNLISSEKFLSQYQETENLIRCGEIKNERGCSIAIMDELSKPLKHGEKVKLKSKDN